MNRRSGGFKHGMSTLVRRLLAASMATMIVAAIGPALAQGTLRIAAVVNDDIISEYDLRARLSLLIASSRLDDRPENRRLLAPQLLRSLVEERLKLQEARRLGVSATKEDIDRVLGQIASSNRIPISRLDDFLRRQGIRKDVLIEKIEADVAWIKVVNQSVRSSINIDNKALDQFLEQMAADEGKTESHVSEIFLPVDSQAEEQEVRQLANRLLEQVSGGASFNALAQSFSQRASAAVSGDLGWIKEGELDDELDAALTQIKPGETTTPIRSVSGFHILHLQAQRKAPGLGLNDPKVSLQQLFLPLPKNSTPAEIESQKSLAVTMSGVAENCEDIASLGKELKNSMSGGMKDVRLSRLAPAMRNVVADLAVETPSEPLAVPGGVIVLMVCERQGGLADVDREEIRRLLISQRLDFESVRYLRALRRTAFVDVRL